MKSHAIEYDNLHRNVRPWLARRGDPMRAIIERRLPSFAPVLSMLLFAGLAARAQGPGGQAPADLGAKIEILTHSIQMMQGELEQSRVEIQQLRDVIAQILRTQANPPRTNAVEEYAAASEEAQTPVVAAPAAHIAEDDWEVLNARVQEHEQTKVESASKYRLKLSGIALFNVFDTVGQVDNLDVPSMAVK